MSAADAVMAVPLTAEDSNRLQVIWHKDDECLTPYVTWFVLYDSSHLLAGWYKKHCTRFAGAIELKASLG